MLARHLERCAACSSFAASVDSFTAELRAAPLVAPDARPERRFGNAERRRSTVAAFARPRMPRTSLIGAAAAVAVMLMTSVVVNRQAVDGVASTASGPRLAYAGVEDDAAMLRGLRDISYSRQSEPDRSLNKRPGILAG